MVVLSSCKGHMDLAGLGVVCKTAEFTMGSHLHPCWIRETPQPLPVKRGNVNLVYHGLDLERFGSFISRKQQRDGRDPANPVIIASVGRAVPKKGYDILLRALALIDPALSFRTRSYWRRRTTRRTEETWLKAWDLALKSIGWELKRRSVCCNFIEKPTFLLLACRITEDGDRDGLPNVIVEACSQGLPCVSTAVSGVPELLTHERDGLLAQADDPKDLARQLSRLIPDPALRLTLGHAAEERARAHFDHRIGIKELVRLFRVGFDAVRHE